MSEMTIERAWKAAGGSLEPFKEISEDRAARELANAHGDDALKKLVSKGKLETRWAVYQTIGGVE